MEVIFRIGNIPKHTNHIWKGIGGTSMQKRRTHRVQHGNYAIQGRRRGRRPIMSLHGDGQRSELELCIVNLRSDANEDKHRRFDGL